MVFRGVRGCFPSFRRGLGAEGGRIVDETVRSETPSIVWSVKNGVEQVGVPCRPRLSSFDAVDEALTSHRKEVQEGSADRPGTEGGGAIGDGQAWSIGSLWPSHVGVHAGRRCPDGDKTGFLLRARHRTGFVDVGDLGEHEGRWRLRCRRPAGKPRLVGGLMSLPERFRWRGSLGCRTLEAVRTVASGSVLTRAGPLFVPRRPVM